MIRAAIFDLDGTLLDSMSWWDGAGELYLSSIGRTARPGLSDAILPLTLPEAADYLRREYAVPWSPEEVMAGINGLAAHFYRCEAPLREGAAGLLNALRERGMPMAVATVTDRELAAAALNRLGVADVFQFILTTDEVGVGKHSPEIYLRAAERLGTKPAETLVFEDAGHAIRTAFSAGFPTVGVYDASAAAVQAEVQRYSSFFYLRDFGDPSVLLAKLFPEGFSP